MAHDPKWNDPSGYDPYIGAWSRMVARDFVGWIEAPPGAAWLDVGSGTGALSEAIAGHASPSLVAGVDPSPAYTAFAAARGAAWAGHVCVGRAEALPFADAAFDAAVCGLALNLMQPPEKGVSEMVRVCRPGGVVGAYLWDYKGGMEILRLFWEAAAQLDPSAADHSQARRYPLNSGDALRQVMEGAGLAGVDTRTIAPRVLFPGFEEYWAMFEGRQGIAPAYAASLAQRDRERLKNRLHEIAPMRPDGSLELQAAALAVKGST